MAFDGGFGGGRGLTEGPSKERLRLSVKRRFCCIMEMNGMEADRAMWKKQKREMA